jgi:hypothetical protein
MMRAVRISLRVAVAPLVRASAAFSAFCRSVMACVRSATVGTGLGKVGLPVIDLSTCCAKLISIGTLLSGKLRMAIDLRTVFDGVVIGMRLQVRGNALQFERARLQVSRMHHGDCRKWR